MSDTTEKMAVSDMATRSRTQENTRSMAASERETAGTKRPDRRGLLRALGAATAAVAAGALLDTHGGVAHAAGAEGPTTFSSNDGATPAVTVKATNGSNGVVITSVNTSTTPGVPNGTGLTVDATASNGAYGINILASPVSIGMNVTGGSEGISVEGFNYGLIAESASGRAIAGFSNNIAVYGEGQYGVFAHGRSTSGVGLHADSDNANAIEAVVTQSSQVAVLAEGGAGTGLKATSNSGAALKCQSTSNYGGDFAGGRAPIVLRAAATAGAPTSGSHITGELFVDSAGKLFFCVAAGTPGTWKQITMS